MYFSARLYDVNGILLREMALAEAMPDLYLLETPSNISALIKAAADTDAELLVPVTKRRFRRVSEPMDGVAIYLEDGFKAKVAAG